MKNSKEPALAEKLRMEKLDKEDALIVKWKLLLPNLKITRRNSRKRRMVVMTAQLLENQANYMKNMSTQMNLGQLIAQQITSLTPKDLKDDK